jgi:uncharacterized membrane protein YccF (DUF307 family)
MRTIANLVWFLLGGFILGVCWLLAGLLCCLTIVGIPLGLQCFKFARLIFWPFGRQIDFSQMGTVSLLANILWLLLLGQELALIAAVLGLVFCVTIVGIPFGLQYFKFAKLAFLPFGARIVKTI